MEKEKRRYQSRKDTLIQTLGKKISNIVDRNLLFGGSGGKSREAKKILNKIKEDMGYKKDFNDLNTTQQNKIFEAYFNRNNKSKMKQGQSSGTLLKGTDISKGMVKE